MGLFQPGQRSVLLKKILPELLKDNVATNSQQLAIITTQIIQR
jgi:hypothetical protein